MLKDDSRPGSSPPSAMRRLPPLMYGAIALAVVGFGDILLTDNPTLAEFSIPIAAAIVVLTIPDLLAARRDQID